MNTETHGQPITYKLYIWTHYKNNVLHKLVLFFHVSLFIITAELWKGLPYINTVTKD